MIWGQRKQPKEAWLEAEGNPVAQNEHTTTSATYRGSASLPLKQPLLEDTTQPLSSAFTSGVKEIINLSFNIIVSSLQQHHVHSLVVVVYVYVYVVLDVRPALFPLQRLSPAEMSP